MSALTFDGKNLHIVCRSGETLTFEDLSKVASYEMILKELANRADEDVEEYWKLRTYEEDYTFKGNVEFAILSSIPIMEKITENTLEVRIREISFDLIEEFFEDKSKEKNHNLADLQRFLGEQFIIDVFVNNEDMWIEEIKEVVS